MSFEGISSFWHLPGVWGSHVDWFEVDASGRRCVWRGEDPVRTPSKKLDPFWRSWGGGKKQGKHGGHRGRNSWVYRWEMNMVGIEFKPRLRSWSNLIVRTRMILQNARILCYHCSHSWEEEIYGLQFPGCRRSFFAFAGRLLLEKIPQQQRIDMFKVFLQTTATWKWRITWTWDEGSVDRYLSKVWLWSYFVFWFEAKVKSGG